MLARVIRFLTENWGLKLAAVGLAILLWLAVTANEPQRADFRNVPVAVDLRDPNWRLVRSEPSVVTVVVQGPRGELVDLSQSPPQIVLPVEQVNDSVVVQVVPQQWIQLPAGIRETRVLAIRPDTVRLYYEPLEARTLPVRVRTRGSLPEGFALSLPINTNPATVEVHGPVGMLEAMDSVPLLPVDISRVRATTNIPTGIDDSQLGGLTFQPSEVNVILRVVPVDSQPGLQSDSPRGRAPF